MKERISNLERERESWAELEAEVAKIYERTLWRWEIWEQLRERPFNQKSIDKLIKDGWKVRLSNIRNFKGVCLREKKEIRISTELRGFERDTTLFHELLHAWYGRELDDSSRSYRARENYIINNWLSRKLRTQTDLLRYAVVTFGFKPEIYDKSSYLAFSLNPEGLGAFESGLQSILPPFEPLVKEYLAKVNKIRME